MLRFATAGSITLRGFLQALDERADALVFVERCASPRALRQRARLLRERCLQLGKHLRAVFQLLLRASPALVIALQIPRRQQDLALPLRDRALLVAHAAAVAVPALRLQEATLERLHLDHEEVGLHRRLAIFRHRVVRDEVARHEPLRLLLHLLRTQLFEVQERFALTALRAATHGHGLPFAAVHRVAQRNVAQPEIVFGADAHGHFFDAGRAPVAAGLADLDGRLLVGHDLDRVFVAQRHELVGDARADLIAAGLRDHDRAGAAAALLHELAGRAVDDQRRRIQRRIGDDFDFDVRAFDGADVARFVVHLRARARSTADTHK